MNEIEAGEAWAAHMAARGGQCVSTCPICRRLLRIAHPPHKRAPKQAARPAPLSWAWAVSDEGMAQIAAGIRNCIKQPRKGQKGERTQ